MCGVKVNERKKSEELRELLGLEPVSLMIKKSRLRWFAPPVSTVRDLGIFVDCDLVMRTHVFRTVHCLAMLSHLRSIRYLVSESVFQSLVTALVLCRLVTVRWLVFRSTFNDASSRSRTQPLV